MKTEKVDMFVKKIRGALVAIQDENSSHYINEDDIIENTTEFVTALACVAPAIFFTELRGAKNVNLMEFQSMAEHLCLEYSNGNQHE